MPDISSLNSQVQQLRGAADFWDTVVWVMLAITALVAVLYFIATIIQGSAARKLRAAQDALMQAKDERAKADSQNKELEIGKLKETAEAERLARIKIEASVEWRTLSKQKIESLASHMSAFPNQTALIEYNADDLEASNFGDDIASALSNATWKLPEPMEILVMREGPMPIGSHEPVRLGVDVWSTGDPVSRQAAALLADELNKMGFDANKPPTIDKSQVPRVLVFVQHRPKGPQGDAKLAANKRREPHRL